MSVVTILLAPIVGSCQHVACPVLRLQTSYTHVSLECVLHNQTMQRNTFAKFEWHLALLLRCSLSVKGHRGEACETIGFMLWGLLNDECVYIWVIPDTSLLMFTVAEEYITCPSQVPLEDMKTVSYRYGGKRQITKDETFMRTARCYNSNR